MPLTRLLLICAVLAACNGYTQQAPHGAIERMALAVGELALWEQVLGPLGRCRRELVSLRWETAPQGEVNARCNSSGPLKGCFTYVGEPPVPVITVVEGVPRTDEQLLHLRRHELRHWLLSCSGQDETGDPMHLGPGWEQLL